MKNKGITLLALLVTIIVILILTSTIIISYDNIISDVQKRDFAREVYTLRQVVLDYEFMNGSYPIIQEVSLNLNSIDVAYQNQFSNEPGYESKSIILNTIDLYKAGVDSLNRGTKDLGADDYYAFSTVTKKVYYIKGQKAGDNTYYTLTDELYKLIDIKDVE